MHSTKKSLTRRDFDFRNAVAEGVVNIAAPESVDRAPRSSGRFPALQIQVQIPRRRLDHEC